MFVGQCQYCVMYWYFIVVDKEKWCSVFTLYTMMLYQAYVSKHTVWILKPFIYLPPFYRQLTSEQADSLYL